MSEVIDLAEEDDGTLDVEVRASEIPGAGLGVFARRFIPKGKVLGKYAGIRMSAEQFKSLYEDKGIYNAYALHINKDTIIDAWVVGNWTRRINATHGTPKQKNVEITTRGTIKAVKNIQAGTELLTVYGAAYWAYYKRMHS